MKTKKPRKATKTGEQPVVGSEDLLDPRLKLLEVNLNTLCTWEEAAGRNFGTFAPESPKDLRLLIWASLKGQVPDITLEQVGSMVTAQSVPALTALVKEKMGTDMGATTL